MNDINIPLLRKSVEWVEEQDQIPQIDREWRQASWLTSPLGKASELLNTLWWEREYSTITQQVAEHCGTAYCVAGKIAADADERYVTKSKVDGVHASVLAGQLLGLTEEQSTGSAGTLFAAFNTAADIRRIAEELAGERL